MDSIRTLSLMILVFAAFGCSHGPCLKSQTAVGAPVDTSEKSSVLPQKIRVFKYDGTKQCGQGKQIAIAEMQKELDGIQVFSSNTKNDGQMRIQMCGAPTGSAHVFEIKKDDLERAKKAGFKEWIFE